MKWIIAILIMLAAVSAHCAPQLSISYVGVTSNNVFNETAPTIRLTVKNETPGSLEFVYWSTDLTIPESGWVNVWAFTSTGTDSVNIAIPPSYTQVYFAVVEE